MLEWNLGDVMTKEFALAALQEIKLFHRRLYFLPQKEPFANEIDFESSIKIIDGIKEYIENTMREYELKTRYDKGKKISKVFYQKSEDESYKRYKQVCYRYIVVKSLLFFLLGCLLSFLIR